MELLMQAHIMITTIYFSLKTLIIQTLLKSQMMLLKDLIIKPEHILGTFTLLERLILTEMEIMTLYLINMQIGVLFHM